MRVPAMQRPGYRTAWQLAQRHEDPDALAALALRTKSPVVLDALALAASSGSRVAADLVADPDPPALHPGPTAALALALAGTGRSVEELVAATRLYGILLDRGALRTLPAIHHQAMGQALFLAGRTERLRQVLDELTRLPGPVRHDLETDLANPHLGAGPDEAPVDARRHRAWQELLGRRFTEAGLEPPLVGDGSGHLFDRLTADPAIAGTVAGPLVTVIMPCFRPDEGLLTSIASISRQSWADLEILVVDDASGPEHSELFDRAVASDERARLVRMDRNGGSYLGRNAALEQARGELVTFQDADDWSHPRRVEHQVGLLTGDPQAPASRSLAVRAKDDLTHQWFGYRSVRDNASSLMLRRSVVDRIGPFAAIRKGADSEYAERVTSLLGPVLDTGSPLAITRLRTGTLSRGDFTYQWSTPERLAFKGSYRALHRAAAGTRAEGEPAEDTATGAPAGHTAYEVLWPDHRLRCPVPRSFVRDLPHAPDWSVLPLAYLGDLSADPGGSTSEDSGHPLRAELAAVTGDGGGQREQPEVGLWHLESAVPARRGRPEMHDVWFDLVLASRGAVVPLTRLEDVRVERLVVLDPAVLLLAGAQPCRLRADRVEVRLGPAALAPDASGLTVDLLEVGDTVRAWWGTGPVWVAEPGLPESARGELDELVPGLLSA